MHLQPRRIGEAWCLVLAVLVFLSAVAAESSNALHLLELATQRDDFFISVTDGDLNLLAGYRDYFTLVVLTSSDPEHSCQTCPMVEAVTQRIARSWAQYYAHTNNLFFVEIDGVHKDNIPVFQGLELESVPHVWLFPPNYDDTTEANAILSEGHFVYKLPKADFEAQCQELADMLKTHLHFNIPLQEVDPTGNFIKAFVATLSVIILFKKRGPRMLVNLGKSFVYKMLAILSILLSITGWQWVRSMGVPFMARNDKNETIVITGGTHYQFGIEIVIVGANYLALAAAFLGLVYVGQYKPTATSQLGATGKNAMVLLLVVTEYFLYSCLTSIAIRKDHDYPYYLTKLF